MFIDFNDFFRGYRKLCKMAHGHLSFCAKQTKKKNSIRRSTQYTTEKQVFFMHERLSLWDNIYKTRTNAVRLSSQ